MDEEVKTKKCNRCKEFLPLKDFHRNRSTSIGLYSWCKKCKREVAVERYKQHPEKSYKSSARTRYRLSSEEFDRLPKSCGICGATTKLHIDHEHIFGMIRGVLCQHCNRGLGGFRDNPELLKKAIHYLDNWTV